MLSVYLGLARILAVPSSDNASGCLQDIIRSRDNEAV
jgi:hypothetical protein